MTTDPTDLDLAELRRVAEGATPGPWARDPSEDRIVQAGREREWDSVLTGSPIGNCNGDLMGKDEDINFIAARSPSVALRLLARLERAEAVCEALDAGTWRDAPSPAKLQEMRYTAAVDRLDAWREARGKP